MTNQENEVQTGEIKATRLGKPITLTVEVRTCGDAPLHVRKVNGKPLYGTTGYIRKFNGEITIGNYSGRDIILDKVQGLEEFCDIAAVTEANRELWINGYPPNKQPK
jgi:hypothetical protein